MFDPYHRNQSIMYNLSIHNIIAYKNKIGREHNIYIPCGYLYCFFYYMLEIYKYTKYYNVDIRPTITFGIRFKFRKIQH